jgi:hypothetical protein
MAIMFNIYKFNSRVGEKNVFSAILTSTISCTNTMTNCKLREKQRNWPTVIYCLQNTSGFCDACTVKHTKINSPSKKRKKVSHICKHISLIHLLLLLRTV